MRPILISIFFLFFLQILNAANDTIDWAADLEFIKTELPAKHYDLFFSMSEEQFNTELDKLISKVPELTDYQLLDRLTQIIARIGDSHTTLDYGPFNSPDNFLPFRMYWFADGIYITHARQSYPALLGSRLVAINGFPIKQVADSITTLIVVDNPSSIKNTVPRMLGYVPHLEYFGMAPGDSIDIATITPDGKPLHTVLSKSSLAPEQMIRYEPDSMAWCWRKRNLFFTDTLFKKEGILYAQYNVSWSKEMERIIGSRKWARKFPSFLKFKRQLIRQLRRREVERFVFDMRFNGGGSSQQGAFLIHRLAHCKKINQPGKLFVITGMHTFSAGIINVTDFKKISHATFIGDIPSGMPDHYGEVKKLVLPSSGLLLNYSTKHITTSTTQDNIFVPDVLIETHFEDYNKGVDPVFEYIRKLP